MDGLRELLSLINETLAAAIVIVSASMLLYNLSRNLQNRVARTSGAVLACVTIAYISDVLVSLGPSRNTFEALLRFQWVGLAFIPAAMFHLSDALLATTGLPSRGRRRRVVRMLYGLAVMFFLLSSLTDSLVRPIAFGGRMSLRTGTLIWLYLIYFLVANGVAFINVERARRRCRTRSTQRRMAYLEVAMLTPVVGVFPFSIFLETGEEFSIAALFLVDLANMLVIFMLVFLAYPLSFFGSHVPDRVVKAELMRFMLLGPATGVLALTAIIYTVPATQFVGVPGESFMPFAVVLVILIWQWGVDLALPWLEKYLIYNDEDDDQLAKLQTLSQRLLTSSDLIQLIGAILEASCDYLHVGRAFAGILTEPKSEMVRSIGSIDIDLSESASELIDLFHQDESKQLWCWNDFWISPLYSARTSNGNGSARLIGLMGVEMRLDDPQFSEDELDTLATFVQRAAQTLDDMLLQEEIYAALEGLLPQITMTRTLADEMEYRPGYTPPRKSTLDRDHIIEQVHPALRHYWGGPGLSSSRLLELKIVRNALPENEDNPARALRAILTEAIENQRPEGERDMRSPEWTIYNILTARFIDKRKARETAQRLYISEANLYRKQNVAIEALADTIIQMENQAHV